MKCQKHKCFQDPTQFSQLYYVIGICFNSGQSILEEYLMTAIHPTALFRLSVLGPLTSRINLERGELCTILKELANQAYLIPGSKRTYLSRQTIEKWYYDWQKGGIDALAPKVRQDKNNSRLSKIIQDRLLVVKLDNPSRSIRTLIKILENQGLVTKDKLAKATVHRFLRSKQLSQRSKTSVDTIERRSFVAAHAGDLWQGDVLHGPTIATPNGMRKTYLVSLLDDASRLITHSAFCLGETALDIEGVLKQAILKRGLPKKLVIDNGPAYRAISLQGICARLRIRLVYCRAREPEAKGKLERYHRTFREQFLNEIHTHKLTSLDDLNARLWAWVEHDYHQTPHSQLEDKKTPLERYRQDIIHIQLLGLQATQLNEIFYHRELRKVRKDATVHWEGLIYEVPHLYVGQTITLVVDSHQQKALYIESASGERLGEVTLLDKIANLQRKRQRPNLTSTPNAPRVIDAVEHAYDQYQAELDLTNTTITTKK